MVRKIVSGGQTGADQAALDTAIELGISHGGWIPKGRLTEAGPLPSKYRLIEMPTSSYPERTEQNVIDSDGTLILAHGELTGGSKLTQDLAVKHCRPCLYVDLNDTGTLKAAEIIKSWIEENEIEVLNVAGPRASKDPGIYRATREVLRCVFQLLLIEGNGFSLLLPSMSRLPRTVGEAADLRIESLPLRDRARIARMSERDLVSIQFFMGILIRNGFGLWAGNEALLESCREISGETDLHPDEASAVVVRELWKRLRETHKMQVVK